MMPFLEVLNFILPISMAINPTCDYFQVMNMGQEYYIYNVEYPNFYPGGTSCRWVARSPPGTQIVMTCSDVDLPPSPRCNQDRLLVSLSGNVTFSDAHNYCGIGMFSHLSEKNSLAVGLFTARYSQGGKFLCTVVAIQSQEPQITTTPKPSKCDCGWRQQKRIVGGTETGVNEYPFMGAIIDLVRRTLYCGASVISKRHAITAAHCLTDTDPKNYALLVGDHDLSSGTETTSVALYVLDSYKVHERYSTETMRNDIAIVKTQNRIEFSDDVGPVCLPFRYTDRTFEDSPVTFLGWGTTEFSGPKSDVLLAANVSVVSNGFCQMELSNKIYASQICTFSPNKDACQYDSGGPVLWYDGSTRRYQLLGVISYGLGCNTSTPAVNTRVSSFLSWVVKQTSGTTYCIK